MFCLSKPVDTNHVPAGLEYPRGGQLEINHDLEVLLSTQNIC